MRGGLGFEDIGYRGVTFKAGDDLKAAFASGGYAAVEGKAVALTGDSTVGFGADLAKLFGKVYKYEEDGYVTVQDLGYMDLPGVAGSLPAVGNVVVGNGAGAVKADATATAGPIVISVDATNNIVTVRV